MGPLHLDTSFLIQALVSGSPSDRRLRQWLNEGRALAMSAIAWSEFLCGPMIPEDLALASEVVRDRVSFDEDDAQSAASFFNQTGRRRGSFVDCMIAATAHRLDAALVTLNREDFQRFTVHGLKLAD